MRSPVAKLSCVLLVLLAGFANVGCRTSVAEPTLLRDVAVALAGFHEAEIDSQEKVVPVVVVRKTALRYCLEVPADVDSSRWVAALVFEPSDRSEPLSKEAGGFSSPSVVRARTLCFRAEPSGLADGLYTLCGVLRDDYSKEQQSLPCKRLRVRDRSAEYRAARGAMSELLRASSEMTHEELVGQLDLLAARARRLGFPVHAVQIELTAVYFVRQRGGVSGLQEAERRLAAAPQWVFDGELPGWAALVAYERGTLALGQPDRLREAWQWLSLSARENARIADPRTITTVERQASLLAKVGAREQARRTLGAALSDCETGGCDDGLVAHARGTFAWWSLIDPDATAEELDRAGRLLQRSLDGFDGDRDATGLANLLLSQAYLSVRQGLEAAQPLAEARRLLAGAGSLRQRQLLRWSSVIEGLGELTRESAAQAVKLCGVAAAAAEGPEIAAWSTSCLARAQRLLGDVDAAAATFEKALLLHENLSSAELGQRLSLDPGQRADDYYRTVDLAVERGELLTAWETLERLDTASARAVDQALCGVELTAEEDRRRATLLAELVALDLPAAGPRREQMRSIRRGLQQELQELTRLREGCLRSTLSAVVAPVQFRAVPLEHEVLLLEQLATGAVRVHRRTKIERRQLTESIEQLLELLAVGEIDDDGWIAHTEMLSDALAPDLGQLGELSQFALYGVLQSVPLAALQVVEGENGPRSWLGEHTTVAVRPASAVANPVDAMSRPPLFVLNPSGNLGSGGRLDSEVAQWFEGAEVLERSTARREAVLRHLSSAGWLHVDAHATYDPAFPELSSLTLADGVVTGADFIAAEPQLEFANLSACDSGSWPTTADSGRYGLGGVLARLGVPWVIVSRSQLSNELAIDFNRAFYQSLAAGESILAAYAGAEQAVRQHHSASRWAAFQLLHLPPVEAAAVSMAQQGGQTTPRVIPTTVGSSPSERWSHGEAT